MSICIWTDQITGIFSVLASDSPAFTRGGGSGFSFDSRVTGLSFDLMGRLPLMVSNNFPNGQLQPYLAVGPGVYFSHIKITPTPVFGSKDSDSRPGIKVAAGSTWMFTRNIGLFGEYRFSHFTADLLGFEKDVNTHRLQVEPLSGSS